MVGWERRNCPSGCGCADVVFVVVADVAAAAVVDVEAAARARINALLGH